MTTVVDFKTQYRTGKDPVDWVLIAPAGADFERTQTWHRVERLRPPEGWGEAERDSRTYRTMVERWAVIGPAYEAWKRGMDIPENGTPLEAWSGVTADQVKFLKTLGIRTVEDVREMTESTISKLRFPNARQLPRLAASFLDGADTAAKDAQIAEMRERMEAMEAMLTEEKPRRGRPPKKESEAA